MVTPLTTPPLAPNSNVHRGMFVWVGTVGNTTLDPIANTTNQQALLNFCGTNKVTLLYLDMYNYLGGATYPASTQETRMRSFLDVAHRSGIQVHALAGAPDWGVNQSWVQTNIVRNFNAFQNKGQYESQRFKGFCLDVEYWTDSNQSASTSCPALCDLMRSMKKTLRISIGCFAAFYLKDSDGTRPTLTYQGKTAQDGEFLMDNSDYTVVGAYRDHAADNGTDGPGQITLFNPWYAYATQVGNNMGLLCGSETKNITPDYTTYYGSTKTSMEQQHTLISTAFTSTANAAFLGQAISDYANYKLMSGTQEETPSKGLFSYLWSTPTTTKTVTETKKEGEEKTPEVVQIAAAEKKDPVEGEKKDT